MALSRRLYLALLALVGVYRLVELAVSRRRQARLRASGIEEQHERGFAWLVLVHVGVLAGSAIEAVMLKRALRKRLAVAAGLLFLLANALRWWVLVTLGSHWNVHLMDSARLGVVSSGPYRWVRHPNYLALLVELAALPLLHSAWLTALLGGLAHAGVIWRRIAAEEAMLMRHPEYRAAMASKPRLWPRIARP